MNLFCAKSTFAAALLTVGGSCHAAANLTPIYGDAVNEGFNSTAAALTQSTTDGNPGTNLGEQRKWAFERALEYWEQRLDSNVVILVDAAMNPLACDAGGAVLGAAGAQTVHRGWIPAGGGFAPFFLDTWYGQALANKIANKDNDGGTSDIGATFNSDIDGNNNCLNNTDWYYALGDAPAGTVSFFTTVLHEIGHGINVQTFVNVATGAKFGGFDDVYMQFLHDHSAGLDWSAMSDGQRASSAIDTNDLHWTGAQVTATIASLGDGTSNGHVEMYAPNPVEGGSSVSHWDTDVDDTSGNSELMEPSATGAEKLIVTDEMLHDMGWNDVTANNCSFASSRTTITTALSGSLSHQACVSVTYNGAVVNSGSTTATAGRQVILMNGFNVKTGATFSAETDPTIGL